MKVPVVKVKESAFKKLVRSLAASNSELESQKLRDLCASHPECVTIAEAGPRQQVSLFGEITALRIVPRAGSPSLEATISDGTGSVVAVWTGRRRIGGVVPGRRLLIGGRGAPVGPAGRLLYINPRYELLL